MGWPIQPQGLRDLLNRVHRDYTGPAGVEVYVTENGAAFDDRPEIDGSVRDANRVRLPLRPPGRDPGRHRGRRAGQGLLLLVAARQLRVGVGIRQTLRAGPGGLRTQRRTVKDSGWAYARAIITRELSDETPEDSGLPSTSISSV